jgi:Putative zinc dependent peptidase (DUF5700)
MKLFTFGISSLFVSATAFAQTTFHQSIQLNDIKIASDVTPASLKIEFNLDNARQTIALLQKQQLTDPELQQWVQLAGTQAVISKVHSSPDTAISAMKKVIAQQPLTAEEKRFQYDFIYKNLAQMQAFINRLDESRDSIIQYLETRLTGYLPSGKKASITLYGLMGSYSSGFAFTDNSAGFYMGLHFYKNDVRGVAVAAEHELFHTIQSTAYNFNPVMKQLKQVDSAYEAPYYLLTNLYLEGSAEYVAEGKPYIGESPFLKNQYEHMAVNDYRHDADFYLLERLLMDTYQHPASLNFEHLYSILFDWNWNNPAYYTGKQMISALVKEYGDQYLKESLQRDALFFVKDYMVLAKSGKQQGLYIFSDDLEKLVDDMLNKVK